MPKVSMTIFINTETPDLFVDMMRVVCWVFGGKDFKYGKSPYRLTSNIGEDELYN